MVFHDRADAGRHLAAKLAHYKGEAAVVFALPRGGVPVAAPIAAMLQAPLDLVLALIAKFDDWNARKVDLPAAYFPQVADWLFRKPIRGPDARYKSRRWKGAPPVMFDPAKFNATETLRDGRRVEICRSGREANANRVDVRRNAGEL